MTQFYSSGKWTGPIAPVQSVGRMMTIPLPIAEEAWKEYAAQGHGGQSLQRINERAGFSVYEIIMLLNDRCRRLTAAQEENVKLCAALNLIAKWGNPAAANELPAMTARTALTEIAATKWR